MDFETRASNIMDGVVDILMHVGSNNYNVPQILDEGRNWGISKRVPLNSIPDGFEPYISRLFLWHSEAIPMILSDEYSLVDLVVELSERGLLDTRKYELSDFRDLPQEGNLLPNDYVPPYMLDITCAIQMDPKTRADLQEKYKIRWHGGVIAYTILGQVQYVVKEGETGLPEELEGDPRIEAVKIKQYVSKNGDPITRHGEEREDV